MVAAAGRWPPSAGPPRARGPGVHSALSAARSRPRPAPAARPRPCPRRPAKLAAPRAAVAPPRRLAPACLDCRHARGREGDVRRVRAFLPSATRRGTHVPGRTPDSPSRGGGASVFIKLAGHGSQVPGFGCAPGAVTRDELCWGKVAASLHSTRTPPTLPESLRLLPRSQEGPTPTLCQRPDLIISPPGVCTPASLSEYCQVLLSSRPCLGSYRVPCLTPSQTSPLV